jgi:hypothetical protein
MSKKTTRESYSEMELLAAVSTVKFVWSIREVERAYKIPESTVWIRMKAGITSTAGLGREATSTPDQE